MTGAGLGFVALRGLKVIERGLIEERLTKLTISWRDEGFNLDAALATVASAGLQLRSFSVKHDCAERIEELRCSVRHRSMPNEHRIPAPLIELSGRSGVLAWEWKE